jgi:hypothetical protein
MRSGPDGAKSPDHPLKVEARVRIPLGLRTASGMRAPFALGPQAGHARCVRDHLVMILVMTLTKMSPNGWRYYAEEVASGSEDHYAVS